MAAAGTQVMLAQKWSEKIDPTGWWMSEKLDGVRAYWTGSAFYSRLGNKFHAPKYFYADLPSTPLDGELWCGRGLFHKTLSIVKKKATTKATDEDWQYVTYLVFDAPSIKSPYEKRVKWLQKNIDETKKTTYAAVVGVSKCTGATHLKKVLKKVLIKNGEGIMLRKPGSLYEHKRSHTLLKVKFFHDEEARVTGHLPGTGRCANMMGKVTCEIPNGVTFKVGSGFTDTQRKNPPKIGSIITFKYQELSNHGNPRFPTFQRERPDLTWKDVCKNAKTKVPFSQIKKPEAKLSKQHSILFSTVPSRDKKGNKIITEDDASDSESDDGQDDGDDKGKGKQKKKAGPKVCKYGPMCFRTSSKHKKEYSHSAKADSDSDSDSDTGSSSKAKKDKKQDKKKTPCKFGSKCYRKSDLHLAQYSHDKGDDSSSSDSDEKPNSKKGGGPNTKKKKKEQKKHSDDEGEWGAPQADSDSDDGKAEMVTIKKKDWDKMRNAMKELGELKDLLLAELNDKKRKQESRDAKDKDDDTSDAKRRKEQ